MLLRKWAREYLCKRFLIDSADQVVDIVFRDPQFSDIEDQDDYAIPEETKDLLTVRLRACGRKWLERHQPNAWYRSFFVENSNLGEPT